MPASVSKCLIPARGGVRKTIRAALAGTLVLACAQGLLAKTAPQPGQVVDAKLMTALQHASRAGLTQTAATPNSRLNGISGPPIAPGKKPGLLYMGADFCPYCASLRWPLVLSLLRFGHFSNLRYMRSASGDVAANTVTFSFHKAQYQSRYLALQSVELEDRQQRRLEKPTHRQVALFKKYNAPPYTAQANAIPFLYIGGKYLEAGAPFPPGLLKNLSWREAAKRLIQPKTALSRQVMGAANVYTAALCRLTRGKPARVCRASAVAAAAKTLPNIH